MIDTLLVSGCSFTAPEYSWAQVTADQLGLKLINLACPGAGNDYICNSVIDYLDDTKPIHDTVAVMVMWSGTGRKDLRISGDVWYLLTDYLGKTKYKDYADCYWLFSGGRSNRWAEHSQVRRIFEPFYANQDPTILCKQNLANFVYLRNYLDWHGYRFRFTSYQNYWTGTTESCANGDFDIGYFAKDLPMYQDPTRDYNWFFVDQQRNGLYEFACARGQLGSDGWHPTVQAHRAFAEQVAIPQVQKILQGETQ